MPGSLGAHRGGMCSSMFRPRLDQHVASPLHGHRNRIPEHQAGPGPSSLEERAANIAPAAEDALEARRRLLAPLQTHSRLRLKRRGQPSSHRRPPSAQLFKKNLCQVSTLHVVHPLSRGPSAAEIDGLLKALCMAHHIFPATCLPTAVAS